jgi:bacterioferritin-associated ferredoxin
VVDSWGASSVSGVSIAGDGAGIGGARVAQVRGRLAGLHAAQLLGRLDVPARDRAAEPLRAELARYERGRRFIDTLFRPPDAFRLPTGTTLVCRCEEITAQQVFDAVAVGCVGPNQMKAFLRTGMGSCQGRLCGLTVTEMMARARKVSPADIGYFHLRFPIKPVTLGELASLPQSERAIAGVVKTGKLH